ncbi:MAG: hypothetical protein LJE95_07195 [Acidobacteria bacterium]|nr:hypothetical protein [Acidobacteriota bacterium]
MKRICVAVVVLLAGALTGCLAYSPGPYESASAPPPGYDNSYLQGSPRDEVGFFYDDLSPYGNWVLTAEYGWVWYPRNPGAGWRPYTNGRWVDTDYGWTWVSFEPYGWATFHYGRWAYDSRHGWIWVPGTIWGPAWVSWQYGGGYVGWAPLPPSVGFEVGVGLRLGGLSLATRIQPDSYCFVPEHSFLQPRISGYLVPRARNVTIIHNTTNITHYGWTQNRVVNRGVDVRHIERATKRRVERFRVQEGTRESRTSVHGSDVRFYRPAKDRLDTVRIRPRGETPPPPQHAQPPAQHRRQQPPPVAPGVQRTQPAPRQIEKRDRREQEQLRKSQDEERQRLERQRQQEQERARAQAERDRAEQRQREERVRQQQEQQRQQQDRARQEQEHRQQQERARQQQEHRQQQERARQQEEQRRQQERARQQEEQRKQQQERARPGTTRRAVPVRPAARTTPGARGKPAPRTTPTPTPNAKQKKKGKERPRGRAQEQ